MKEKNTPRYLNIVGIMEEFAEKDKPLLEVGVREGFLFDFLQEAGFTDLYGIDISPDAIKRLLERGHKGEVADAMDFKLDRKFHTCITSHCIEHCPNPKRVISNIYDALEDGGIVFVRVPRQVKRAVPTRAGHYFLFPNMAELKSIFDSNWKII